MCSLEIPVYSILITAYLGNLSGTIIFPFAMLCGNFLFTVNSKHSLKSYLIIAIPSIISIFLIAIWPAPPILLSLNNFIFINYIHRMFSVTIGVLSLLYLCMVNHQELYLANQMNKNFINELEFLSNHDPLTKLYNRRSMLKLIQEMPVYTLIMFDIDDFKKLNDTYGHEAGDLVLTEISKRIKSDLPENAAFSRWGGEEFLIAIPEQTDTVILCASKICETISKTPVLIDETPVKVTITGGVSFSNVNTDFKKTLSLADKLLYEGKNSGKNKMVFPETY
ncbi:MAG: GGDEF domain-containing protein [Treponema sp.]|nr:GGDEF domain-containing protein [Treponema sp.]